MIDFVYICRSGDNEELRYSIRSVVQSFPEARIWVVGGKPDWYSGHHIAIDQNSNKYTNAFNNITAICESKEISDSFVFMNDDFFILKRFDQDDIFHGGLLIDKIKRYKEVTPTSGYIRKLEATYSKLISDKINPVFDYELHVPMMVEKKKLERIIKKYPTLLWRSMYGNLYNLGGKQIKDVKIYTNGVYSSRSSEINEDSIFVSTEDNSFKSLSKTLLFDMFPNSNNNEQFL